MSVSEYDPTTEVSSMEDVPTVAWTTNVEREVPLGDNRAHVLYYCDRAEGEVYLLAKIGIVSFHNSYPIDATPEEIITMVGDNAEMKKAIESGEEPYHLLRGHLFVDATINLIDPEQRNPIVGTASIRPNGELGIITLGIVDNGGITRRAKVDPSVLELPADISSGTFLGEAASRTLLYFQQGKEQFASRPAEPVLASVQ
jgi:hypothetical protein